MGVVVHYTHEGTVTSRGGFGYAGYGLSSIKGDGQLTNSSGGGSGYYGGSGSGSDGVWYSASGGSSYISGYNGCNSIAENSTASNIIHTGSANHYSGKVFSNTAMLSGDTTQPSPNGGTQSGNYGNGIAKFSIVSRD